MKKILEHVKAQRDTFAELPFFHFLRSQDLTPSARFVFAPAGAPFIMGFSDLNRFALYQPDSQDPLQQLINVHSREDATHYKMYLDDLAALGFDLPLRYSDALQFLWSDERKHSRLTCNTLHSMIATEPIRLRLVVVEAVEAAGAVAFGAFTNLAAEYTSETGKGLRFFGEAHKELESGHTMGTEDIVERLHAITLDDQERTRAHALVDQVFESFSAMMEELHSYALKNPRMPANADT